jgi:hypothetical protein
MRDCQEIQARLSAFIDGDLEPSEQAEIRAHVERCAMCGGVAQDLTRVRDAARALGPVRPPDHVWLEVAGQIRLAGPREPRQAPTVRMRPALVQWLGLAAALVVITLGAYFFTRFTPPAETPTGNASRAASVEAFTEELRLAIEHSERAGAELEALIKSDGSLDPQMADALQRNLAVLNQAIAESGAALTNEPSSLSARASLFEALSRKISVLQSTVVLMNEMRQGNAAGAARAAEALRKS